MCSLREGKIICIICVLVGLISIINTINRNQYLRFCRYRYLVGDYSFIDYMHPWVELKVKVPCLIALSSNDALIG